MSETRGEWDDNGRGDALYSLALYISALPVCLSVMLYLDHFRSSIQSKNDQLNYERRRTASRGRRARRRVMGGRGNIANISNVEYVSYLDVDDC